jgi:hypothetical protein
VVTVLANGEGEPQPVGDGRWERTVSFEPNNDGPVLEIRPHEMKDQWSETQSLPFQTVLGFAQPHGVLVESIELLN